MKLAFFDAKPYDIASFSEISKKKGVDVKFFEPKLDADTARLAKGFDAVCVFVNDKVDANVIDVLCEQNVRLVALRSAGYNNVDVKYAYKKLHVVHVPSYSPHSVAEHAAALLLTSVRRIHKAYNRTREFNFSLSGLTGFDLCGKTVGIIGTGKIGKIFANICKGFSMNVLAYDKFPDKNAGLNYVSLDELFAESDVISLHCPLNEETEHILDENAFEKMKKGVIIINTSRGKLVDSAALLVALKERKVGAACLDVYEEESDVFFCDFSNHIVDDDLLARLISLPNVIVTSHQAFLTKEALENIAETTLDNVISFFSNDGFCENELCYRCGKIERCKKERREKCF